VLVIALASVRRLVRLLSEPMPTSGSYDFLLEDGARAQDLDADSDEISFRRFVTGRWAALQRYAFILAGDHQIAEDVVQAGLEKCWRRWGKIRWPLSPRRTLR
jgi:hypothetical protein